ncbi:MAG: Lrp/AsnC family transcriptional regulator [Frankiales bacterium]|nr:Lrp/AsnC family transcriptional regulator [Frankiales bacterium]
MPSLDALDADILRLFVREPRVGVLEASRRLGVARGTVQARLDKLTAAGVITGWGPALDAEALGFPVSAFATLEISQRPLDGEGGHAPVAEHLRAIPEVLEAHTITGAADLMVRLVARSNADLQRVIDDVVSSPYVVRASTVIVLATEIAPRLTQLLSDR